MFNEHESLNMIINKTNVLYTQVKLNEKRKERIKLTRRRSEVQIPNWTKEGVKCEKWLWLVASSKNIVFRRVEKLNVTIETHLKSVQNEDPIRSFNLFQCKFHYAGCIRYMYLIAIMIFCRWADSPSWKCTHIHIRHTYGMAVATVIDGYIVLIFEKSTWFMAQKWMS